MTLHPLSILASRLRAQAAEEDQRRLQHSRGSFMAGLCRGRAFALADVAEQLEAMLREEHAW